MNTEIETTWKNLGTLVYSRRLTAFNDARRAGLNDADAIARVQKLFGDLATQPLEANRLARDQAAAAQLERGE